MTNEEYVKENWIDFVLEVADSNCPPWLTWFNDTYCNGKCMPLESGAAYCEDTNMCQCFPDWEDYLDDHNVINLWKELEHNE